MHWFDCLELGVKTTYGLKNFCFNAGACGKTSNDLLKRLDRDVVRFAPDVVIVTVGGVDLPFREASEEKRPQEHCCTCIPLAESGASPITVRSVSVHSEDRRFSAA